MWAALKKSFQNIYHNQSVKNFTHIDYISLKKAVA